MSRTTASPKLALWELLKSVGLAKSTCLDAHPSLGRAAGVVGTYDCIRRGNTQIIRVEKLEVQPCGQALVGTLQRG